MFFVAWQMLTADRAKYLGLIFAIAFSTFLMSHQTSIFAGLMGRTRSQISDVRDADIWVMDPKTQACVIFWQCSTLSVSNSRWKAHSQQAAHPYCWRQSG